MICSFTLVLIAINKNLIIDTSNVDIFDMMIKASFALIGSVLSGFVAFLIFTLQQRKSSLEQSEMLVKIDTEFKSNVNIIQKIYDNIASYPSDDIYELIAKDGSQIRELLVVYSSQLDFTVYDALLKSIQSTAFKNNIDKWKKVILVRNYLKLITEKSYSKENATILIDQLKSEMQQLKSSEIK